MLRPLENRPLFVREDEAFDLPAPVFTEVQINALMSVYKEDYNIPLGAGGTGTRYTVTLPNKMEMSVCRVEEPFYGNAIELVNEFVKEHPTEESTKWVLANINELNYARRYWAAHSLHKKAELLRVSANLATLEARNFAANGSVLTEQERKQIVLEYGYDPELSFGY